MAVRVCLELVLPDWWGADDAWEMGGKECVKELIWEDISAFAEDAEWYITRVNQQQEKP